MILIRSESFDPYYNLAAEEFLLKSSQDDIILLYRNRPSVVIGKHQNALAEADMRFLKSKGIKLARRISGGGTVYHDPGNLNFSFIRNHAGEGHQIDFTRAVGPIVAFLQSLGLNAHIIRNNSLVVNGMKVSGNSAHVFRSRTLHHGTLLFEADLEMLNEVIQKEPDNYHSKAVRSVRATVTNLKELLNPSMNLEKFTNQLVMHLNPAEIRSLSIQEEEAISILAYGKYNQWEWNFGYSPDYTYTKKIRHQNKNFHITLFVSKGIILEVRVAGEMESEFPDTLKNALINQKHDEIIRSGNVGEKENSIFAADLAEIFKQLT